MIDDELHQLWSKFPQGSRIVVISDSCASGTIIRSTKPISDKEVIPICQASGVLISGCRDNQYSYDGEVNGAFTEQLLKVWNNGKYQGSYKQLRTLIAAKLPKNQNPNYLTFGAKDLKFLRQKPFTI